MGQLKLNESGTAPLLPALPLMILPFFFHWALALNQFRKLHWLKQLFFFPLVNFFAGLVSEQDEVSASSDSGERMDLKGTDFDLFKLLWNYTLRCTLRKEG